MCAPAIDPHPSTYERSFSFPLPLQAEEIPALVIQGNPVTHSRTPISEVCFANPHTQNLLNVLQSFSKVLDTPSKWPLRNARG